MMHLRMPLRSRPAPSAESGRRYCDADVLAAAALEHQPARGGRADPTAWKWMNGRVDADIVAGVLAGDGSTALGGDSISWSPPGGRADRLAEGLLGAARGVVDVEDERAGVLADGRRVLPGHLDVFQDGPKDRVGRQCPRPPGRRAARRAVSTSGGRSVAPRRSNSTNASCSMLAPRLENFIATIDGIRWGVKVEEQLRLRIAD